MSPLLHEPLRFTDSFRLLYLLPGANDDTINTQLRYERLKVKPQYEALSYEWATPALDVMIRCNQQALTITGGLAAALKQLRSTSQGRWLWVDAICIDQGNTLEKNQQVAMMRDIYMKAERVLIWLGEDVPHSIEAVHMIQNLAQIFLTRSMTLGSTQSALLHHPTLDSIPDKASLQLENKSLWTAVFDLFSRSYFQRTWIVQEIVVSSNARVLFGSYQTSWRYFHWAAMYVSRTDYLLHQIPSMKSIAMIVAIAEIQKRFKAGQASSLTDHLLLFQGSQASDPRDKVYGLLGILVGSTQRFPTETHRLKADYRKSLELVFQEATQDAISLDGDLRVLHGQSFLTRGLKGMPSWIPDWSNRGEGAPTAFLLEYYRLRWCIAPRICFRNKALLLRGRMIDRIDFVTDTMSCEKPLPDIKKIILKLSQLTSPAGPRQVSKESSGYERLLEAWDTLGDRDYCCGRSLQEALWRTLIGNIARHRPAQIDYEQHFQAVMATMLLRERGVVTENITESRMVKLDPESKLKLLTDKVALDLWIIAEQRDSRPYFLELVNTIQGRIFFVTLRGYMGFAAPGTAIGDEVSVLGGGWTPFVLRPSDKGCYNMVGDSYVHGIMDGEDIEVGLHSLQQVEIR
ncbi:hypothetical protein LTR86_003085 [Recurvomyces mirabilis]|nr:hypothetical protein LTR86_003085 [Recurvomyces mirabilis]